MPLYDYRCEKCDAIFEDVQPYEQREIPCPLCQGGPAHRIVSKAKLDIFKAERYEELGDDAPEITSKQHLAEECAKRGIISRRLLESYNQHRKRREI